MFTPRAGSAGRAYPLHLFFPLPGSVLTAGPPPALASALSPRPIFLDPFAAILLLSELNLAPGTVADATADVRRVLVWAFATTTVAYLIASLVRLPRAGVAVAAR